MINIPARRGLSVVVALATALAALVIVAPPGEAGTPASSGRIVYSRAGPGFTNDQIWTMNPDGTNKQFLVDNGTEPDPSPDGSKIAFTKFVSGSDSEIHVINADGTGEVNVTNNTVYEGHPTWSPDGTMIAYEVAPPGFSDIAVMNADGSNQHAITEGLQNDNSTRPDWSPDGTRIAFESTAGDHEDIWTMDPEGANRFQVTDSIAVSTHPNWSPDGTKIAYNEHFAPTSDFDGLFTINPNGSLATKLAGTSDRDVDPDWSPDGQFLTFLTLRHFEDVDPDTGDSPEAEIYKVDVSGGTQVRLTDNLDIYDKDPAWGIEPTCISHPFSDVPPWVDPAVDWAYCGSYMNGFGSLFKPLADMNRAQVANVLYNLAGMPDVSELPAHELVDVPAWVEDAVTWLLANEYATGYQADATFRPLNPITRAAVARMLFRIADPAPGSFAEHTFIDVPGWVDDAVSWLTDPANDPPYATGFGNLFKPLDDINRAQTTRMICRIDGTVAC